MIAGGNLFYRVQTGARWMLMQGPSIDYPKNGKHKVRTIRLLLSLF
jgi:hypothetical protein